MNWIQENKKYLTTLALVLLMALTRSDHFGSAISLPDASLAAFYLAGIFTGGIANLVILLAEAALLDYVAITHWQVSDYCISPAYVFLIPTYAVMFFAGRLSAQSSTLNINTVLRQLSYLVAAASLAFLISNGSFYLLSGKFPDMSLLHYSERVMQYYPAYVRSTLIYSVLILFCTRLATVIQGREKHNLA